MSCETYGIERLEPQMAANLRDYLWRKGDVEASRDWRVSRLALVRAAAGLPVQRRVRDIVRAVLRAA